MIFDLTDIFGLVVGFFTVWIGVYMISKNPRSVLSWVSMLFLFSVGYSLVTDYILNNSHTLGDYIAWQKRTDWPIFFHPIFYFHAAVIVYNKNYKKLNYLIVFGYLIALFFTIADVFGGLILNESVLRYPNDFTRFDAMAPGALMIPMTIILLLYVIGGTLLFANKIKGFDLKYVMPFVSGLLLSLTILESGIAMYYKFYFADFLLFLGLLASTFMFAFSMLRYHLFAPKERVIFDRAFYLRTAVIILISLMYLLLIPISGVQGLSVYILISLLLIITVISHSFYDLISTFVNDIVYNISSGFSIVTDREVSELIKNYHNDSYIEESSLLDLSIVKSRERKEKLLPVDVLKGLIS